MGFKEKDTLNIEGRGKMLVQHIGKKIVLIGRKKSAPKIEAIVSVEIDKENLLKQNGEIVLREPYEELKTFNFGNQKEHYLIMDDYLKRRRI